MKQLYKCLQTSTKNPAETDVPKLKQTCRSIPPVLGRAAGKFMATAKRLIKWDTNCSTAASSLDPIPNDISMIRRFLKLGDPN
jgi:hypothetical protein